MIHPSGLQTPKDSKLKIKTIKKGLYIVENAYVGEDEYFPDCADAETVDSENENEDKDKKVVDSSD